MMAAPVKRIDAADGNAYTKQEFMAQYGGLAEWNASLPARGGGGGAAGGAGGGGRLPNVAQDQKLVDQVKELQRSNPTFRAQWVQWCDLHAEGTKDPRLLKDSQLRTALRVLPTTPSAQPGSLGGGGLAGGALHGAAGRVLGSGIFGGAAFGGRPAGGGRGLGGAERRVDPADGNSYTKEEFVKCYGGLSEWNSAGSAGSPAGRGLAGRSPMMQQMRPMGVRSTPYPTAGAMGGIKGKSGPSLSDQQALAEQVRSKQRADPDFRQKWVEYCDANKPPNAASGTKDPHLHTAQFLRRALQELTGVNASAVAVLAQAVMEKQRSDPDFRAKWVAFCARETGNTCDPRRLDEVVLQKALRECDSDKGGVENIVAMVGLVDQVRAKQRESKEWVAQWTAWCKEHNNGTFDPARFTAAKLQEAWAALKNL